MYIKPLTESSIIQDSTPLPPPAASAEEDDKLFEDEPWVEPPMQVDYGFNIVLGKNVFINFHSCFLDTCSIKIGSRTLVGPHVNFYSGTHPLDPNVRNGTRGPELGKPIVIGEDCWLGGNVTILPGVTIGDGAVVGAGSVVTKVRWQRSHKIRSDLSLLRVLGRAGLPRCGGEPCQGYSQNRDAIRSLPEEACG